jgi:protoporphyrinogen oxidase
VTRVIVLGAGPAGLAAALELAEAGAGVTLIDQQEHVGGNAASFELAGIHVDYGSHRLHPASNPKVLARIRQLLGDDLLTRPRHGRIRLMGRWIHFPLRPVDLALRMHPRFAVGVMTDMLGKVLPGHGGNGADPSFASVLQQGLGSTICREFYFPYARKIWGLQPEEISPIQAYKRVSAGSLGKMLKRLMPGGGARGGASTKGIFYYPRFGFGQISQAFHRAALQAGVEVLLGTPVERVQVESGDKGVRVVTAGKHARELSADQVFSTIPVTSLVRLMNDQAPQPVQAAARALKLRSMVLAYLLVEQDRFTEYDAHYFPEEAFPFTRLSETKNYTDRSEPQGRTVLCAELPCDQGDALWTMNEDELRALVTDGLARAGLPVSSPVLETRVVRIPSAYPLFQVGYEEHFAVVDDWVSGLDGVLSFGRQGLYVHDNTHHAIYMAQAAAGCLREDGTIDADAWAAQREIFATHVVED